MKMYEKVTFEQIGGARRRGAGLPAQFRFLPEGGALTYLFPRGDSTVMDLVHYNLATGERRIMAQAPTEGQYGLDEELRRERARVGFDGITQYQWKRGTLMVPNAGRLWVSDGQEPLRPVAGSEGAEDPELLADGQRAVFVRDGEVHMIELATGATVALTSGAGGDISHGVAEFAAQEELRRRRGYWVDDAMKWLAFQETDASAVPHYPITHQADTPVWVEDHRYPFAGADNVAWRIGLVPLAGGSPPHFVAVDWPEGYLARVQWSPAGELLVLWLARDHRSMEWWRINPATGAGTLWWRETDPLWINLPDRLTFLQSGDVLFDSERTGFRHLYRMAADGTIVAVTEGDWEVTDLLAVDETTRQVYFAGSKSDARERQLYRVGLDGGELTALSSEPGIHQGVVSPADGVYVDQVSSLTHAPVTKLVRIEGGEAVILHEDPDATAEALGLVVPEMHTVTAADGHTTLYGALYRPQQVPPGAKLPVVVSVYGGPGAQTVTRSWGMTSDLQAQYLVQHGFLVWKLDNRGMHGRGKAFEAPLHRAFATVEVQDQVTGVQWLTKHAPADPDRVGVFGWSYGGYMTLMLMLKAPEVFKVGVAGAPVTDYRGYDTAYTERYMETPETNPEGYREATVMEFVDRLRGKLLVIHGMIDENVHFRHTARLIEAFIKADRDFDLLALPSSRHSARGREVGIYRARRTLTYFEQNL